MIVVIIIHVIKNNNDEDVESNNADALKKVDNSNTICISPYGNTCDSYYVTYPFDIENGYIPINIAVKKKELFYCKFIS